MHSEYYGWVYIEYWEYLVMFFYLVVMYLYFARQKNIRIKEHPEYRWFIPGFFAKVFGGIFFSLIYFYYYHGGDTTAYFFSSVSLVKLLGVSPSDFLHVWLGDNTVEARSVFTMETGKPYLYLFLDDRQYMVVRLITPFTFISMNSYLITTVMFASVSYAGVWKCYQTFYRYYPRLHKQLAIAVLMMPSAVVWGSSILKDTITFSAFCWFIHALDNLWFRKVEQVSSIIALVICTLLMVWIKPYIFMVLLVVTGIWISYSRVARIRNAAIKYLILPVGAVGLSAGMLAVLNSLGDQFGKFSLSSALAAFSLVHRRHPGDRNGVPFGDQLSGHRLRRRQQPEARGEVMEARKDEEKGHDDGPRTPQQGAEAHLGIELLLELAGVRALGIGAAGDEGAELADLDQHRRAAAIADLVGLDPLLEVLHLLAGGRKVLLELLVKRLERLLVVGLALFDLVEIFLEAAGVLDVDDVFEALAQQIADDDAHRGRLEAAFELVDVLAILQHGDDRRVGARPADAVLFELFHQRRFGEARRRLGELLLGPQGLQLEPVAGRQRRQDARLRVIVVALVVGRVGLLTRLQAQF